VKFLETGRLLKKTEFCPGLWSIWTLSPNIALHAQPGQFVQVRTSDSFTPLLRRPLSIARVDGETLELVWRVVGEGTKLLAESPFETPLDLLGPLGNPFTIPFDLYQALLVGGGIGLPPLVFLFEHLQALKIPTTLLLGAKDENAIPLSPDDPLLPQVKIILESSNSYRQGLVTELVTDFINENSSSNSLKKTALYACGPWGMIRALQRLVPQDGFRIAEVSVEQQMGCGIGVCQGCAVRAEGGVTPYRLTCVDGPVFPLFSVELPNAE